MGVRAARFSDLLSIRALAQDATGEILLPPAGVTIPSATALLALAAWQTFGHRFQCAVARGDVYERGFVQAVARQGRESWDIVRLACLASEEERLQAVFAELLDHICLTTAQWGALRMFIRVPSDSLALYPLGQLGFRTYAAELTFEGMPATLTHAARAPGQDIRLRLPQDAWDIFSLYCAVTPALVRHAEGRSLREWLQPQRRASRFFEGSVCRELVVGEQGELCGWMRVVPQRGRQPQLVEILLRPDAAERLAEMFVFAVEMLGLQPHVPTLCRAREYDGRISATLESAGHQTLSRETLLVRHTVARVTERQLLLAALRAQGLGIDISHYRRSLEPTHQRLASTREAEQHSYDQFGRICFDG